MLIISKRRTLKKGHQQQQQHHQHLTHIMEFHLTTSSQSQSQSHGTGYRAPNTLHSNFYFLDVFDEDAINVQACVQALHHLIAKADAQINHLQDQLAILTCQRNWAQPQPQPQPHCHPNLFGACCAAFQTRIHSLSSSILIFNNKPSQIPKPAERIHQVIAALITTHCQEADLCYGKNLVVSSGQQAPTLELTMESEKDILVLEKPDEEGHLFYGKNLVVSSSSHNVDTDVGQQVTSLELTLESKKLTLLTLVPEKLDHKTVAAESSSGVTSYTSKELAEVRSMGSSASNIQVSEKIERSGHASEGISGFLTSNETLTSLSPLQASNDEANSKSSAPQQGKVQNCIGGSKTGGSDSSILVAKAEAVVKVEQDCHDAGIRIDSAGSFSRARNHEGEDSVDDHLETLENQAESVSDLEITYSRKKSSLSNILKPPGQKVQMKNLDVVRTCNWSITPKPQKTSRKRKSSSVGDYSGQSGSSSSDIEEYFRDPSEANWQRKLETEENAACGNTNHISQSKSRQPEGARRDISWTPALEKGRGEKWSLASESPAGIIVRLKNPRPGQVDAATPWFDSSFVEKSETTQLPIVDLENLKKQLSENSNLLNKLTVPKLREIAKVCKMRGTSKTNKESLIEELLKYLTSV